MALELLIVDNELVIDGTDLVMIDDAAAPEDCDCDDCGGDEGECCGPCADCCYSDDSLAKFTLLPSDISTGDHGTNPYFLGDAEQAEWDTWIATEPEASLEDCGGSDLRWIAYSQEFTHTATGRTGRYFLYAQRDCAGATPGQWTVNVDLETFFMGEWGTYDTWGAFTYEDGDSGVTSADCCGVDSDDVDFEIIDNTCCNDDGTCIEGEDVNCDGDCDSDDPCPVCDPTGAGATPEAAVASNIVDGAGNCNFFRNNANCPYTGFNETANYCEWTFGSDAMTVQVFYIKNNIAAFTACLGDVVAGKWYIQVTFTFIGQSWGEETTGIACSVTTGKISGVHIFSDICIPGDCANSLTITIDP